MDFFVADTHFGHENILAQCQRPFASLEEMDAALIERWNAKVGEDDHVYVVGDVAFRNARPASWYLSQLRGHKHLIVGNHDASWMGEDGCLDHFASVHQLLDLSRRTADEAFRELSEDQAGDVVTSAGGAQLVVCHYPLMSWGGIKRGTYLVHGHIHNNTTDDYWALLETYDRALNAGVDVNGYEPVTFEELVRNNARFRQQRLARP